jgi:hypothetical protein
VKSPGYTALDFIRELYCVRCTAHVCRSQSVEARNDVSELATRGCLAQQYVAKHLPRSVCLQETAAFAIHAEPYKETSTPKLTFTVLSSIYLILT